jgi:uncharacterized membrane protein YfcA
MAIVTALLLGSFIGALVGLLGGGGSILAVPALVYVLSVHIAVTIPISLIVIGLASAVGAVPKVRAGQVQWRLAGIRMLQDKADTGTACTVGDLGINWRHS